MRLMRRHVPAALTALAVLAALPIALRAQAPRPPRLVVVLAVDQLRSDYLDRHRDQLTGGLRRIVNEGAVFENAAFPYLNTVTCAGHATIGTGALPFRHGMVLNAWYDRATRASTTCADDPTVKVVSYHGIDSAPYSGRRLLVPTLADRLREQARGRVVSLSLKGRSAIGLAGQGGDAVTWFDERGGFVTSTAYTRRPVAFMERFFAQNPITADYGRTWDRLLEPAAYTGQDDVEFERPPSGWTRTFPHRLETPDGKPAGAYFAQWMRSPFADEYLARMATHAVDSLNLGRGRGLDFLGISFSTLDITGHGFGPQSHEVQDLVLRLDRTIDGLLDHLDKTVGTGNYVLALSSDHGVSGIPEMTPGGGRHTSADLRAAIDGALEPLFGPAPAPAAKPEGTAPRATYLAYSAFTDLYLSDGTMERLRRDPKALAAVLDALRALPGITHAFNGDDLITAEARTEGEAAKRAAALNYHPGRSGDLIVVPREHWILSTAAATHGTHHPYDSRVPVIFYGAGVVAGRYAGAATPADIAPTLAALAQFPAPAIDGRVLTEAVGVEAPARKPPR
jgi:predicted AlkP superfamily pyrophosphatase or phosphodiesterase